ncbi:ABC transporter ATP-binding protein [Heliophilum fasciatum]|uniref:Putative ABC transport system ATP-binding protein n=1 Tax=Heliophilum fasciatum TaxID=35700 RepID=A0A4R2R915_9FIRM|nr:ATP-binding cassette domain-containing protein [Heliophilum fasciatum]MCW2279474.1 putative ABC transport system ATP-binding protein [Heliophilum fasciatum]TCP59702.1 putative ABC transport system ATP-binding protein [Heliophilum fasciatum]
MTEPVSPLLPLLSWQHLSLHAAFTTRPLLTNLTGEVRSGEILAVMGPSGSGKSTLLTLLNRMRSATSGSIVMQGKPLSSYPIPQLRRQIAYLPQQAVLFPGTVADNLTVGCRLWQIPCDVPGWLAHVDLDPAIAEQSASTLSGGQAQRLALARTLALEPTVLLLDEPTSALDGPTALDIERLIQNWVAAKERAVIWVTHDPHQAERIASRLLRIEAGQQAFLGKPGDTWGGTRS